MRRALPGNYGRIKARLKFLFVAAAAVVSLILYGTPWNLIPCLLRKYFYPYTLSWFSVLLRSAGAKISVRIDPAVRLDQPYVAVSNHRSHYDIPATACAVPIRFHFVAKRSLFFVPILASGLRRLQMVCIDRRSTAAAYRSLENAARQVARGRTVLLYPEGGIVRQEGLGEFKMGAFNLAVQAQVPLLPILVSGSAAVFDLGSFSSQPGTIHVQALEPVPTAGLTREDVPALIERVRQRMIAAGAKG